MALKICAISDTHGWLPDIPDCNLFILAGDFCPTANHSEKYQRNWVMGSFWHWLSEIRNRCAFTVGICGNHDFIGERRPDLLSGLPWQYLCDHAWSWVSPSGRRVKFWGCPHTKKFNQWAFMKNELALRQDHSSIPEDTDILIMHGPPFGYGDLVTPRNEQIGSPALTEWIEKNQPKLVICGHNHGGFGTYRLGETLIANVSYLGDNYQPRNPPQVIEIDL